MGNNLRKAFLMMALLFSFSFMNAQHAHMNLGNLLESLPEVKTANTQLEALQKSLATKGQTMMDNYQKKAIDIQSRYQKGELSEVQARQEAEKLQLVEQKISAFDQDATMQIQKKRQELMQPILIKVDQAIQAIAKEKGYKMIFDTSIYNALLFAKESDDITELVKAKI